MYYITADSTGEYPEGISQYKDFYLLPMPYTVGGSHFLLGTEESMPLDDFYKAMSEGAKPTTSCISPHTAMEKWSETLKMGADILHLGFSSGLSSSFKNAQLAAEGLREEFPERKIILVDTLSAGIGEAILADIAVNNRDGGMDILENAKNIEALKEKTCHYFIVGDLFHLRRGGRISTFTAIVGTAMQIKPILIVNDQGQLICIEKTISRKMALKHLLEKILEKVTGDTKKIYIEEAACREDADTLKEKILEKHPEISVGIVRAGPIILSHTGLGLLGATFIGKSR